MLLKIISMERYLYNPSHIDAWIDGWTFDVTYKHMEHIMVKGLKKGDKKGGNAKPS